MRDSDEDLPIVLSFDFRIFFNSPLKKLILTDNQVGDEGARALSEGLKANKTLEELHLDGYHERGNIGPEGAKYIAEMLKVNSALKVLNLAANEIGKAGAAALAAVLPKR